jgi:DNA-binding MarR family transcriptional regulator
MGRMKKIDLAAICITRDLDIYEKMIYIYLLVHNKYRPTYNQIASNLMISDRKVKYAVNNLEERGYILKKSGAGRERNKYVIIKEKK